MQGSGDLMRVGGAQKNWNSQISWGQSERALDEKQPKKVRTYIGPQFEASLHWYIHFNWQLFQLTICRHLFVAVHKIEDKIDSNKASAYFSSYNILINMAAVHFSFSAWRPSWRRCCRVSPTALQLPSWEDTPQHPCSEDRVWLRKTQGRRNVQLFKSTWSGCPSAVASRAGTQRMHRTSWTETQKGEQRVSFKTISHR